MKRIKFYILILCILMGSIIPIIRIHASTANPSEPCNAKVNPTNAPCVQPYVLLAPLPGAGGNAISEVNPGAGFGHYLNLMIKIFIGLCAVLSVVMIVIGGIEYMTSELVHSKESGKERIEHAILGLLIALGAYALLFTINPDLIKVDLVPGPVTGSSGVTSPTPAPAATPLRLGVCDHYGKKSDGGIDYANRTTMQTTETDCYNNNNGIKWTANP